MSNAENQAVIRRMIDEVFNTGDTERLADYCVPGSFIAGGLENQIRSMRFFAPDLTFTVDEMLADGDKVVVRVTQAGTNTGPLVGLPAFGKLEQPVPATGRSFQTTGIYLFTLREGKLASFAYEFDQIGMLRQLGWTISPPGA